MFKTIKIAEIKYKNLKSKNYKQKNGWKNINKILHDQKLFFTLKIIWIKFINSYHNNLLINHSNIYKIKEFITRNIIN